MRAVVIRPCAGRVRHAILLGAIAALLVGFTGCAQFTLTPSPSSGAAANASTPRLVGYLPDYHSPYSTYAQTLDFTGITHLILAFGHAPVCNGACTAGSDMTISLRQNDPNIAALVTAAHTAGVKVLISLGGGDKPGDASISQFYLAGLSAQLADSVDRFVASHDLDGVDVDIEDAPTMGAPYGEFVSALASRMHGEKKLLSVAMAPYLQSGIPDSVLSDCDFINVETYSSDTAAVSDLQYYAVQKTAPADKLVLGVPFFGITPDRSTIMSYSSILAAYPDAWQTDEVSGGSLNNGATFNYLGESTMTKETQLGAQYGGVMVWEISQDAPAPHSLLDVIRKNL